MSLLIKGPSTPSPTSAQTCVFLVGVTRLVSNVFKNVTSCCFLLSVFKDVYDYVIMCRLPNTNV